MRSRFDKERHKPCNRTQYQLGISNARLNNWCQIKLAESLEDEIVTELNDACVPPKGKHLVKHRYLEHPLLGPAQEARAVSLLRRCEKS